MMFFYGLPYFLFQLLHDDLISPALFLFVCTISAFITDMLLSRTFNIPVSLPISKGHFLLDLYFCYSSAMRWFEWGSVLQACLHKHFLIQISIWWNHQASCFHEYGNKKMSWLNCNLLFPYLDCQDCHIISGSRHKRQRKIQHKMCIRDSWKHSNWGHLGLL